MASSIPSTSTNPAPAADPTASEPSIAEQTFPSEEDPKSSWGDNSHISYDQSTSRWIYEDPSTGKEYEYNDTSSKWVEVIDENAIDTQQHAYGGDEDEQVLSGKEKKEALKRKRKLVKEQQPKKQRINSSLFISNLPLDTTIEEIAAVFSRYGIIAQDDLGEPRIKLYTDESSRHFKGEALLSFFKPESCNLAITLLDGTCLRDAIGQRSPLMKVQMAEWSGQKNDSDANTNTSSETTANTTASTSTSNTGGTTSQPPAKKPRSEADKRKAAKRFARMNEKLQGWDSDSESEPVSTIRSTLHTSSDDSEPTLFSPDHPHFNTATTQTILLKHLFTPSELESEPELLLEIKDDIREECSSYGTVSNVVLYDLEEDGIVSVRFAKGSLIKEELYKGHVAAKEAVRKLNARFFAGKIVLAYLVQGKIRYRRSDRGNADEEQEEEQGKDGFGEWLSK
ncbi:unnamed protein product [Sympodiomycopsis kandeliae]